MKKIMVILLVITAFISIAANSATGKIEFIELEAVSDEQAFQIHLDNNASFCTHESVQYSDAAYLYEGSQNFEAILRAALIAYSEYKTVEVAAEYSASRGNRCIITKLKLK